MDRRVKERLIGATILVVLIVLIVPELLSGPKPRMTAVQPSSSAGPSEAVRNVTVDLTTPRVELHVTADRFQELEALGIKPGQKIKLSGELDAEASKGKRVVIQAARLDDNSSRALARTSGPGALNTIWIEDANNFLQDALHESVMTTLTTQMNGYYDVVPRAVTAIFRTSP